MVEVLNKTSQYNELPDIQYYRCLKCLELKFLSEFFYGEGLGYL